MSFEPETWESDPERWTSPSRCWQNLLVPNPRAENLKQHLGGFTRERTPEAGWRHLDLTTYFLGNTTGNTVILLASESVIGARSGFALTVLTRTGVRIDSPVPALTRSPSFHPLSTGRPGSAFHALLRIMETGSPAGNLVGGALLPTDASSVGHQRYLVIGLIFLRPHGSLNWLTESLRHSAHRQKVLAAKLKPMIFHFDASSEQSRQAVRPDASTMNVPKMRNVTTLLYFYFFLFQIETEIWEFICSAFVSWLFLLEVVFGESLRNPIGLRSCLQNR